MRLRHWSATALSLAFLLASPALVLAQDAPSDQGPGAPGKPARHAGQGSPAAQLPQACVDAGASSAAECKALLSKGKAGGGQPKAPSEQPAQPAARQPTEQPAPSKPAGRRALTRQNDQQEVAPAAEQPGKSGPGNQFKQRNPADNPQEAAPAAGQPAAAEQNQQQPRRARLPKDCVAAGITTQDDCTAFRASNTKPKELQNEQPAAKPTENAATPKPAPEAKPAPATKSTPETKPAEPASAAGQPTGKPGAAPEAGQPAGAQQNARLSKDCLAAGMKTQADCDAMHAINTQKGKGQQPAEANQPAQTPAPNAAPTAAQQQPGEAAPAGEKTAGQPTEIVPNLPKGVSKDEIAPLFDSAKDQEKGKGAQQPGRQGQARPARNLPPPTNDKAAQSDLKPVKINPIDQTKGQEIQAGADVPKVQVPQNVTIVNQTTVNNTTTTTNNVTNEVQNNNGPGVQQNNGAPGGQQAGRGPRPGEFGPGGVAGNGPDHGRPGGPRGNPNPIGLGLGVIMQLGNQMIINSPGQDQRRIAGRPDDRTNYERLPGDNYRETIARPDGVKVVTIYNRNGDIIRRSRFDRNGHEVVLAYFDAQDDQDLLNWRDPGDDLPPLQLDIPPQDYVLDADNADEQQVQQFFAQPPVEQVQRLYSIDEVKRSARIRDMVRRLEIGDLTFDTGAATIAQDQVSNLSSVAQAMLALLQKNPAETFLIEGHTDAVGSEVSNLQLSDERAATVAQILTDFYHIPPENLATQGYGERFLIVQTDGPERVNRRVTIRRITPLVTVANQNY